MGKLSFNDKLHMQTLREQGLGAKAVISAYPDKGWMLSTVKKVCSRVDHTGSAVLRKPGSGRRAIASACTVCHCKNSASRQHGGNLCWPTDTWYRMVHACCIYTVTWCSLYQCFAALPPNGQLAYWYCSRLPVYRSAVRFLGLIIVLWNFVPFKFAFNITFHS